MITHHVFINLFCSYLDQYNYDKKKKNNNLRKNVVTKSIYILLYTENKFSKL